MTWFKIDDSFYDHPKVFDAPDCAVALWTRAGTWSARNLTDGFVPTGMPARFCPTWNRRCGSCSTAGCGSERRAASCSTTGCSTNPPLMTDPRAKRGQKQGA
jgi:hypothetical protein